MRFIFNSSCGGNRAMGKARHMLAIKDIIPNLVKAALNFPKGGDVTEDGSEKISVSADVVDENSALLTTLVDLSLFKRFVFGRR